VSPYEFVCACECMYYLYTLSMYAYIYMLYVCTYACELLILAGYAKQKFPYGLAKKLV